MAVLPANVSERCSVTIERVIPDDPTLPASTLIRIARLDLSTDEAWGLAGKWAGDAKAHWPANAKPEPGNVEGGD